MTNSQSTQGKVHVRLGEVAASVAVSFGKLAQAGGADIRTHWTQDADGYSHKVAVKDVMWSAGTNPGVILVLDNGQEFELEVRPSSKALREARNALDAATQHAERDQDEQRRIADLLNEK